MGQLLISKEIPADVNLDGKIDQADIDQVRNSASFSDDSTAPSSCPGSGCGREDVNRDGKVNPLDETSILQSAALGTNVTCGGVYAKQLAFGSTQRMPLFSASDISFDSLVYFNDDGLSAAGVPLMHMTRNSMNQRQLDDIVVTLDDLDSHVQQQKARNLELNVLVEQLQLQHQQQSRTSGSLPQTSGLISMRTIVYSSIVLGCGVCLAGLIKLFR